MSTVHSGSNSLRSLAVYATSLAACAVLADENLKPVRESSSELSTLKSELTQNIDKEEKLNGALKLTEVHSSEDAERFINLLPVSDKYQKPNPQEVLEYADELNSMTAKDVLTAEVLRHPGFQLRFAEYEKLLVIPCSNVAEVNYVSACALVKWAEISRLHQPKIETGPNSYAEFQTDPEFTWRRSFIYRFEAIWEGDALLKKAQEAQLQTPGLPLRNEFRKSEFTESEINRARIDAVVQIDPGTKKENWDLLGRALDLAYVSVGSPTIRESFKEKAQRAAEERIRYEIRRVVNWPFRKVGINDFPITKYPETTRTGSNISAYLKCLTILFVGLYIFRSRKSKTADS